MPVSTVRNPLTALSSSKPSSTAWYDSPLYYDMVYADYTKKETRFIEGIMGRQIRFITDFAIPWMTREFEGMRSG